MKKLRVLGKSIEKYAKERNITDDELGMAIGCTSNQVRLIMAGRLMCPYSLIEKVAETLRVAVDELVYGDETYYGSTVVSCMTSFTKEENRELILDIVYDCLDVIDASQE